MGEAKMPTHSQETTGMPASIQAASIQAASIQAASIQAASIQAASIQAASIQTQNFSLNCRASLWDRLDVYGVVESYYPNWQRFFANAFLQSEV
jgi:hypothetical protein